jgi:hypothetical protein
VSEVDPRIPGHASLTGAASPVPPLVPGEPPLAILIDYDGTVALTDVSDTIMAEHVHDVWEAEVAAYDAGLLGSRRLMEREVAMISVPATTCWRPPRSSHTTMGSSRSSGAPEPPGSPSRSSRMGSAFSSSRRSARSGWATCRS